MRQIQFGTMESHIILSLYSAMPHFEEGITSSSIQQIIHSACLPTAMGFPSDANLENVNKVFTTSFHRLLSEGIIACSPYYPDKASDPQYRYTVTPNSFDPVGGMYDKWKIRINYVAELSPNSLFRCEDVIRRIPFPESYIYIPPFLNMLHDQGYLTSYDEEIETVYQPTNFPKFTLKHKRRSFIVKKSLISSPQ